MNKVAQLPSGGLIDYRDVVILELSDSEAALFARVRELEISRESYRVLSRVAIHVLHHLRIEHERLRAAHCRTLDECRNLRKQSMREEEAA